MYHNIPFELRQLNQWVCSNEDKIPLNPRNGDFADCNEPNTWGTFEEAVEAGKKYIGFVLTKLDPYCVIDLDYKTYSIPSNEELEVHKRILENFDTYTERSANGLGYHIVAKGLLPKGRRRGNVEVYSQQRYMIFTGNVVKNTPINDCQDLITQLVSEMPDTLNPHDLIEEGESISDTKVVEYASNAVNGDKFDKLCNGDWQSDYNSQSEADFALMAIIAFYTKSNEQCRRIFRVTALGKRDKAQRDDYLNFALSKIRAVQNKRIEVLDTKKQFDLIRHNTIKKELPPPPPAPKKQHDNKLDFLKTGLEYPKGLMGDIAKYFFSTSIRPVKEISILSALAFVAGVTARSFNISGSGLNQYLIVLAKTGSGKEGAAKAIEQMVNAVRHQVPGIDDFIGPAAFSSGQALIRALEKSPCFVSILGEFGLTLQQISDMNATSSERMFKKVLLDIYGKSGRYSNLRSSVYSDAEKNTKVVTAPNMTLLGESVPESFFENLEQTHIADGLIPRFSIIEYTGTRPERNKDCNHPPTLDLVNRVTSIVSISISLQNKSQSVPVQTDNDALQLLDMFDSYCDSLINSSRSDVEMQLWNRGHLKALKIAALLAVANNPLQPVITYDFAEWAIEFVKLDVNTILSRFSEGNVGLGENKQAYDLRTVILTYATLNQQQIIAYQLNPIMWKNGIIPLSYLSRRCFSLASFRKDRAGSRRALSDCIKSFIDQGLLVEFPTNQLNELYNTKAKCYVLGDQFK
jgi:hypothetical protein